MMALLKAIWDFPAHHISLGWWIAIVIALWNFVRSAIYGLLRPLSIFHRGWAARQLAIRIRVLERLHENTNSLIRYLAADTAEIAFEIGYSLLALAVVFTLVAHVTPASVILIVCLNVGSTVVGRAWRIRRLLNDLSNFDASIALLKARLLTLESRSG